MSHALVATAVRSGVVESVHLGSVVGLDRDGAVALWVGEPDAVMLPRSANKPMQATALLELGLPVDGELLALAAASHSGEAFHQDGVRRLLAIAGLDESALRTPADWPLDEDARVAAIRAGQDRSPLAMNCSGKHAAMLATAALRGWPTGTYLDPAHPVQQAIAATISRLAGEPVGAVAVDGCGAPLFGLTLAGLARAFRAMAVAAPGTPERAVVTAIQTHPDWTSGTARDEAQLIRAVPGLFGKAGAEAVYAVALDDGRAAAVKVGDGSARARPVVMAAALARLGVDHPVLDGLAAAPLLGGGVPVGEVRSTL